MHRVGRVVSFIAVLSMAGLLFAQTGEKATAPARGAAAKKAAKGKPIMVTPEREAAVMTFVERNHPQLSELLTHLKTSRPQEYERAVREIFRTTERLALIQERDAVQYELEIAAWTRQSRVQLLAARLKMGATDELQKELREALAAQGDAKLALLKHERQKAADRLGKFDSEIAQFENDREKVIDKQLELLTKAAASGRSSVNLGPKSVGKQAKKSAVSQ